METIDKVIFLDFDGVISTPAVHFQGFDPECIERLKRIIDETNAFIVITLTWRKLHSLIELKDMLHQVGISRRVLGVTDITDDRRDDQIQRWLDMTHPRNVQVKNIVVIDDDTKDLTAFEHVLVTPDGFKGLQDEDVEQAIRILQK